MKPRWGARRDHPSHADDWMMTYADMITLLLCFFTIFLSLSIAKKDAPKQVPVATSVSLPVQRKDLLEGDLPFHGLDRVDHQTEDLATATPAKVDKPPAAKRTIRVEADTSPVTANAAPSRTTVASLPDLPPQTVDKPPSQGPAETAPKGDRITILEVGSAAVFGSGSATLSTAGEAILQDVAVKLKSDAFKDYEITVEGHSDDTPIHTSQFPSNWELSTARASAVVHYFLDQGIPAQKLRAAGYADTFPKVPNRDANGNPIPENQAQNRRVVIKLEKIEPAEPTPMAKLGV